MSLTSHEESPGEGSHIDLEEMDGKETAGSGVTVVSPSAVADKSRGQAQIINQKNGEEENAGAASTSATAAAAAVTIAFCNFSQPKGRHQSKKNVNFRTLQCSLCQLCQKISNL